MGTEAAWSERQHGLWQTLGGPSTHVLAYGGSRSGKTYLICRALVTRAVAAAESSHCVLRYRFNATKTSLIYDTFPTVVRNEFSELPSWESMLNKSDWFAELPNKARLYFGGLDEKERTEKILGQGHSTLYLNECSQIPYASATMAITRLSQTSEYVDSGGVAKRLRLKAFYDTNPPLKGHWTYKLFLQKIEPTVGQPLADPSQFDAFQLNAWDNPFLPKEYLEILKNLPPRERVRFVEGEFGDALAGALWTYETVEASHMPAEVGELTVEEFLSRYPMQRIVVAVDPSGCRGKEDTRSDEIGIVAVGLGMDGHGYVLEDASERLSPQDWGARAVAMYRKWRADCVIAESNFGGAMVEAVVRTVDPNVPYREVHAARGKAVRAEPVAALYDRRLVHHRVPHVELEEQMTQFSTAGFIGDKSPDRADAAVWGLTDLMVQQTPGQGLLDWYVQQAAKVQVLPPLDRGWEFGGRTASGLVALCRPANGPSVVLGIRGTKYVAGPDGVVCVLEEDVAPLIGHGFAKV
jgi:hypothetical protein